MPSDERAFHRPFRGLSKRLAGPPPPERPAPPRSREGKTPVDGESLFRAAVEGVVPVRGEPRVEPAGPSPTREALQKRRSEAEALATLFEIASGGGRFDVQDTEEHVEGMVEGLDRRVLDKLRAGEFARQAHVDLHGLTLEEAKPAVRQFLFRALRAGHRCVLVIHGRGRNSPDRRPVLKDAIMGWLSRGELSRIVLAFASARGCDGGPGATYVLLRRRRPTRRPFTLFEGSRS